MAKKLVLKKDLIVPKGTEFKLLDHKLTLYRNQNYEAMVDMQDTTACFIYIDPDVEDDRFEKKD